MNAKAHQTAIANVVTALHAQNSLNSRLDKEWHLKGWPYYRAAWTEMTEAIEHLNWFWWKQGTFGRPMSDSQVAQVHMELVDVLHFGLSMHVIDAYALETVFAERIHWKAEYLVKCFDKVEGQSNSLVQNMERFVSFTIASEEFEVAQFAVVCQAAGLTLPKLLLMYFAKQTLNKLRWNNGYDLTKGDPDVYVKMWPSTADRKLLVEDNVHLVEVLNEASSSKFPYGTVMDALADGSLVEYLYGRLSDRYSLRNT